MSEKNPATDFSNRKKSIRELLDTPEHRDYKEQKIKKQKRNGIIDKIISIGYSSTIVKYLIYINTIIFIVTYYFTPTLIEYGAIHNITDPNFQFWQIITSMFLHGGFQHLFFNMLTLWFVGILIEKNLGTKKFILLYIISGITSSILCMFLSPVPAIGASGAICGIMAAMIFFSPESKILLLFVIPIKIKHFIYGFSLFSLVFGLLSLININYSFGVAHFGHLGGLIGGYLIMYYWKYNRKKYINR